MGRRKRDELFRKYPWLGIGSVWRGPRMGKWWKRKLHKARRRYIKGWLRGYRQKESTYLESTVNWRAD